MFVGYKWFIACLSCILLTSCDDNSGDMDSAKIGEQEITSDNAVEIAKHAMRVVLTSIFPVSSSPNYIVYDFLLASSPELDDIFYRDCSASGSRDYVTKLMGDASDSGDNSRHYRGTISASYDQCKDKNDDSETDLFSGHTFFTIDELSSKVAGDSIRTGDEWLIFTQIEFDGFSVTSNGQTVTVDGAASFFSHQVIEGTVENKITSSGLELTKGDDKYHINALSFKSKHTPLFEQDREFSSGSVEQSVEYSVHPHGQQYGASYSYPASTAIQPEDLDYSITVNTDKSRLLIYIKPDDVIELHIDVDADGNIDDKLEVTSDQLNL